MEGIEPSFFLSETGGMPVYTKEEIKEQLEALNLKIAKAEDTQEFVAGGPGSGQHTVRGLLGSMYKERERLSKEYERLETLTSGQSKNLARFPRPL